MKRKRGLCKKHYSRWYHHGDEGLKEQFNCNQCNSLINYRRGVVNDKIIVDNSYFLVV